MKKSNIKYIFNDHSTERFFERTALNVTKKEITKAVITNQLMPFKRVNATRSMTYIKVRKEIIKTVMHRKKSKIITILPWKSIFHYRCTIDYNDKLYRINLYPDCYLETKKYNALTKIYETNIKGDNYNETEVSFNHHLFKTLFDIAWLYFLFDEDHKIIKDKRRIGNETFEISNQAKENPYIIREETNPTCIK